jgi:hypothetical protein
MFRRWHTILREFLKLYAEFANNKMASHGIFTQKTLQTGIGPTGNETPDTIFRVTNQKTKHYKVNKIKKEFQNFLNNLTHLTGF